jgi:hypothetical protein
LKLKLGFNWALVTGLVMGLSAAAAQAFFKVQPPVADGISFLGHPTYLLKWLMNNMLGTDWYISKAFVVFPALTVVGVIIGSFTAAYRNKELKLRPGPVKQRFLAVIYGFMVINFGLLWGSCPIRTALLVSYGSALAVIALASIVMGVILACVYLRLRAKKAINR